MTKAAFYAPLKPPDHPVPSGDRTMAQSLVKALERGGIQTTLASTFQSRDAAGNDSVQAQMICKADEEVSRLIAAFQNAAISVWVTYHNYYKAPDLIGPKVSAALGIPYMLIEATRAKKRLGGPWARYAEAAEAATDKAKTVFYLTERDGEALHAYKHNDQKLVHLAPFLARDTLPTRTSAVAGTTTEILSVGMFRPGDKVASYRIIADTLKLLPEQNWHLSVIGDGAARDEIRAFFRPVESRVTWQGELDADAVAKAYQNASILFWPGVNEAFGMSYLEAQAAGVVAVGQDRPGVRDVLAPGLERPDPDAGAAALARVLGRLLDAPELTYRLGTQARTYVEKRHLIQAAERTLCNEIEKGLS